MSRWLNAYASACVLAIGVSGCAATSPAPQQGAASAPLQFDARVVHVPLEGGFYGLATDDGRHYEPLNLAPRFEREGLRLRLRAEPADVASIRMWGRPVRILDAEILP